ncbi:hypothetical protein [Hyalangium gracile]|uniref:hypothetical protein n=1 Tax=Hyalangium gracile TaxID=394092 RepID=UPI001CC9AA9D|nr:hypothetical protein [Hyalangium gracile]
MYRLVPLALLLLVACGKSSETPEDPPGKTPEVVGGIQGSLVVHMPIRPSSESLVSAHALLGDGSRFRLPLDAQGSARFEDPSIVGPQDVSVVFVRTPDYGGTEVYTVLGINQPEVWLSHPFGPSEQTSLQGTVSGKVTGASGNGTVTVTAVNALSAYPRNPAADGAFTLEVHGVAPGQATLFAWEVADDEFTVLRAGLKRGVTVGGGQAVSGQDVALDHPVDQLLDVGVEGLQAYGSVASAEYLFFEGEAELFRTDALGSVPLKVPTVARTPPFDTTRTMLRVKAGDRERLPSGRTTAEVPVASTATSASVKLLAPMRFESPTVGTNKAPPAVPRSGLTVRWSADPEAQLHRMGIAAAAGQAGRLNWIVWAPPSITSFTPFALPAEVSPHATLATGRHAIEISAYARGDVQGYEAWFGRDSLRDGPAQRDTGLMGYVNLQ